MSCRSSFSSLDSRGACDLHVFGRALLLLAAASAWGCDKGGTSPRDARTRDASAAEASPDQDEPSEEEPAEDEPTDSKDAPAPRDAGAKPARDASTREPLDDEPARCDAARCDEPGEPPRAGFELSETQGTTPLWVEATRGAGDDVETLYDWGEGDGLVPAKSHRYRKPGTYTVTQEVRGASGLKATATKRVEVSEFVPVRFNPKDATKYARVSPDGYEAEVHNTGPEGIRSDGAVAPGSGVFYFEGRRLREGGVGGSLGLATAAAGLVQPGGSPTYPETLGVYGYGAIRNDGGTCTGKSAVDTRRLDVGFVVDYRGASPVVHIVSEDDAGTALVVATCTMAVTTPVFIHYAGERALVGYELRINTGADTTNQPFHHTEAGLRAALTASGAASAASALVMGFGKTRAPRVDRAPTLTVTGPTSVRVGQAVTLEATAEDVEDGTLSERVVWSDLATQWHLQPNGKGARFTFTPDEVGRHPVRVSVTDDDGVTTTRTTTVVVTGDLAQARPVQLVRNDLSGQGVELSSDGLSARFTVDAKNGVRANQGIYGRFWYFEVHRNVPLHNMGIGLMLKDGSLNPYDFVDTPWSMSINVTRGIWVNLIGRPGDWTHTESDLDYGFAVDYRGEHPIVHVIVSGVLRTTQTLTDVWVPMYPMVYGNASLPLAATPDLTVNFGATPFRMNPRAALTGAGIDASALKLGWGD